MSSESKALAYYKTPIGTAVIQGTSAGIESITISDEDLETSTQIPDCLKKCVLQLDAYFKGSLNHFDLLLNPKGTEFQKKVWSALIKVPFGTTRSYLEQSRVLGDEKAIRAVASANGKNPIWIIIPCHRIIGSDGSMTGYAGGKWRKRNCLYILYNVQ